MSQLVLAQQAIGAGDIRSARDVLTRHLRAHPGDEHALYLLAVCEQASGNEVAAIRLYSQILGKNTNHFGAHYNMGLLLSNAGQDTDALPHHDAAVRLQPQQFWAYVNRGNAKARLGSHEAAIDDYRCALKINPQTPETLTSLGNALREIGRLDEALNAHEQALQQRSNFAEAWTNKAATLIALKRPEEALHDADKALGFAPENAQAWSTRGAALQAIKRLPEALVSYERAVTLQPNLLDAWHNRGNVLGDMRRHQEAIESYDQALKIGPSFAQAWFYRGMTLVLLKSYPEAMRSFETALKLAPGLDRLRGAYLHAKMATCDWEDLDNHIAILIEDIQSGKPAGTPLGVAGLLNNPVLLGKLAATTTAKLHPPQAHLGPIPHRPRSDKIRLGYYSADFRAHPVAQLLVELIEHHDKSRFELIGFSFGPDTSSPLRQRIAAAFDQFIDVDRKSDREIALLSRDIGIDIAINLGGYTDGARTDIFAMRAAPVQVSYLGYPGTMGAEYMDYLITDRVVCPEGSQTHYTEKLAYLPHCFMPHDSTQEIADIKFTRSDFALPEYAFVFCCFNNHNKITPQIFDVWMRLLQQVPGSVLWLSDGNQIIKANLAKEANARGVDPARLVFARRIESMAEHLARYRLADLFIDTLPYNAHTTACDALWAGVPVLTCAGESFASRVAASLLQAIGLPELVTATLFNYENLALELAGNPSYLAAIRQKLANNRLTQPLFNTKQLTISIENLYVAMHQRHLDGSPPGEIHV